MKAALLIVTVALAGSAATPKRPVPSPRNVQRDRSERSRVIRQYEEHVRRELRQMPGTQEYPDPKKLERKPNPERDRWRKLGFCDGCPVTPE